VNTWNGDLSYKGKTCTIYIPVEGQSTPAELMVHPEIAERWKTLYNKRKEVLTPMELQEFVTLVGTLSAQAGKPVFYPKD
jgi:hypothetical protein